MAWSRSRCSARSPTRHWRHGRRRAAGRIRSSAAFAPCRPLHTPMPSSFSMWFPRCSAEPSTWTSASTSGPIWSAPAIGRRSVSLISRSISSPSGWRCCRPTGFVGGGRLPTNPSRTRCRPDLDPCLHRLVELFDRSRPEQHQGLRVMTSSPWFRRFAFAYGTAFAILYVIALKLDLALFTVYPDDWRRSSGHAPFARHRRALDGELLARDVLVRLDRHGRARSADICPCCRAIARAMDTPALAGLVVGGSRAGNDGVRLPHDALVSTLAMAAIAIDDIPDRANRPRCAGRGIRLPYCPKGQYRVGAASERDRNLRAVSVNAAARASVRRMSEARVKQPTSQLEENGP